MSILRTALVMIIGMCIAACARPISDFRVEQSNMVAPATIEFVNESQNAESYEWDLGDGTTSMDANTQNRYLLSGKYKIALKAKKGKKTAVSTQEIIVQPPKDCLVEIATPYGNMIAKLYEETPRHRENFIKLADEGFYDSLLFHRVIDGFMIQGGDPLSRNARKNAALGSGGPGYKIDAEIENGLVHKKGALAAARQSDTVNPERQSSGSQFYIVQGRKFTDDQLQAAERRFGFEYSDSNKEVYKNMGGTPQLDYQYTVFGEVISGMDVIDKIATVATDGRDRPKENVYMKVTVIK